MLGKDFNQMKYIYRRTSRSKCDPREIIDESMNLIINFWYFIFLNLSVVIYYYFVPIVIIVVQAIGFYINTNNQNKI